MNSITLSILVLGVIGLVAAVLLYALSRKFAVDEDEAIGKTQELLPGANCGGCGFAGCGGLASALVKNVKECGSLNGLSCPVGGDEVMNKIADLLGVKADASQKKIAVVRCQGCESNRPRVATFDGPKSCKVSAMVGLGETLCANGCLGMGDCVSACQFGAISFNDDSGIPVVDADKCGGCGACATACPRNVIEVRAVGPKNRHIYVSCINKDKGPIAMKVCTTSCIACKKCVNECPFEAITIENNVAHIDATKCKLCRKCVAVCPRQAIVAANFPIKKETLKQVKEEVEA